MLRQNRVPLTCCSQCCKKNKMTPGRSLLVREVRNWSFCAEKQKKEKKNLSWEVGLGLSRTSCSDEATLCRGGNMTSPPSPWKLISAIKVKPLLYSPVMSQHLQDHHNKKHLTPNIVTLEVSVALCTSFLEPSPNRFKLYFIDYLG